MVTNPCVIVLLGSFVFHLYHGYNLAKYNESIHNRGTFIKQTNKIIHKSIGNQAVSHLAKYTIWPKAGET